MGDKIPMFKVGDEVVLTNIAKWYGGKLKPNEECVITDIDFPPAHSDGVIWVKNTKGIDAPVYLTWVSAPKLKKGQQLLFSFMDE